jgi:hypothetical protein
LELRWKWVGARRQSPPATNYGEGTSWGFCAGQANWLNFCSVGKGNWNLKENNEIVRKPNCKDECLTCDDLRNYKLMDNLYSTANSVHRTKLPWH